MKTLLVIILTLLGLAVATTSALLGIYSTMQHDYTSVVRCVVGMLFAVYLFKKAESVELSQYRAKGVAEDTLTEDHEGMQRVLNAVEDILFNDNPFYKGLYGSHTAQVKYLKGVQNKLAKKLEGDTWWEERKEQAETNLMSALQHAQALEWEEEQYNNLPLVAKP